MEFDGSALWDGIQDRALSVGVLVGAAAAVILAHVLTFRLAGRWARRSRNEVDDLIVRWLRRPTRWLAPELVVLLLLPTLRLPDGAAAVLRHGLGLLVIGTVAWLIRNAAFILRDLVISRYDVGVADNLKARQIHTQVRILQRVVTAAILVIATGAMLMTFEQVRQFGVSLLASAGVLGIILGFAAQRTIATVFAGLQIAITQPIRLDDVVIVEGEWGRIEEITLTYVIVRIWDLRRLVVPIQFFIERPFQHWTRVSADILGTVFLRVDWRVPVDALREELHRLLQADDRWDEKSWGLVVTDTSDRGVELRALMSAADASKAWDLRCAVREALVSFLQREYPECLPRVRAELRTEATDGSAYSAFQGR